MNPTNTTHALPLRHRSAAVITLASANGIAASIWPFAAEAGSAAILLAIAVPPIQ